MAVRKTKHEMPEQSPKDRIKNFNEVPYGYDVVDGLLVPNEIEQEVLLKIHSLRKNGWTLQATADELNEENIHTKNGGKWWPFTISQILKNEIQ